MNSRFVRGSPGLFKRTLALAGGALAFSLVANGATSIVTQPSESALRDALAGGGLVSFACDGTIILTTNQFGADGRIVFHVDTGQSSRFYRLQLQ
jgi:hypothetical protein